MSSIGCAATAPAAPITMQAAVKAAQRRRAGPLPPPATPAMITPFPNCPTVPPRLCSSFTRVPIPLLFAALRARALVDDEPEAGSFGCPQRYQTIGGPQRNS
jgi:hypothetical protein